MCYKRFTLNHFSSRSFVRVHTNANYDAIVRYDHRRVVERQNDGQRERRTQKRQI